MSLQQHVFSADELLHLVDDLLRPTAATEVAVLAGCLLVAWGLTRLLRGAQAQPGSIWFGDRVVDGVLFPILALLLGLAARELLRGAVPIVVFKLAIPILVSLVAIRLVVRVLHVAFPASRLMRVVERSISWAAWLAVVLWITGVMPWLLEEMDAIAWTFGKTRLTLRNLIEGSLSAVLVLIIALWLSAALEARLLRGATAQDLSVRKIAANALRAMLIFVGLLLALSAVGIDLTAFSVLGGAIGVGLGFGLQKLAANYVSGFVILAERSLRIGDLVKVDGFEGRITDINTRFTVIRALNGRESIVPNELLITQRVENASLADPNVLLTTTLQVDYGTDIEALRPKLVAAVAAVPRVQADPPPSVHLSAFASDGLELTVMFWFAEPDKGLLGIRGEVNLALLRTLNESGVGIPYPQRVLRWAGPPAQVAVEAGSTKSDRPPA